MSTTCAPQAVTQCYLRNCVTAFTPAEIEQHRVKLHSKIKADQDTYAYGRKTAKDPSTCTCSKGGLQSSGILYPHLSVKRYLYLRSSKEHLIDHPAAVFLGSNPASSFVG
ncbi:hypothetical protein Pelo_18624 [Pelomyxa schiedti]|nr:hypothetical protein Pelo_18624 [Pelomyxa schiedti]